ncbi:hypothetical protein SADUNF_Sadunf04G0094900 [Salix dunnii]|uniref:Uncharacterized protein n=1 Tax=Salix dunnii TaxID=1413687 RepID=A0A835MZ51_9ROSI|nr:hypothetical protein SADUNF_Sadunf04G0094900 [Salix dunnii]
MGVYFITKPKFYLFTPFWNQTKWLSILPLKKFATYSNPSLLDSLLVLNFLSQFDHVIIILLSYVVSSLGVPLHADIITLMHKRLTYARVCVEIDAL